jgi:ABC-2 type transport system ATP-binding protein
MLRLTDVTKCYGKKKAVDDLTLEVRPGEVFGLLGPNGAGKTTTLKMISGLVFPDSGGIAIAGIDALKNPDEARAKLAFVPDQPTLYPKLTGREFLMFLGRARGLPAARVDERIRFCENLFEMSGWLGTRAETYSHGMTQRVALSAAFLSRPSLYVIDEPLVGLDPAAAGTFSGMTRAAADGGASVILSSHTLSAILKMCDRIGIIHEGRLAAVFESGSMSEEVLENSYFEITGTRPADAGSYFSS